MRGSFLLLGRDEVENLEHVDAVLITDDQRNYLSNLRREARNDPEQ